MLLTHLALIAVGLILVGALLILASRVFKLIFSYSVRETEIVVLLFHAVPIYRIPFHVIETLHEAPVYEVALIPGMHLFTRPFARRVVIEMRDRWAKYAFLTPNNPTEFIADIKRRMAT
jgi:hypothetical protein